MTHEWINVEGNSDTVGITDHAQDYLGDVVYVELLEMRAPVCCITGQQLWYG